MGLCVQLFSGLKFGTPRTGHSHTVRALFAQAIAIPMAVLASSVNQRVKGHFLWTVDKKF